MHSLQFLLLRGVFTALVIDRVALVIHSEYRVYFTVKGGKWRYTVYKQHMDFPICLTYIQSYLKIKKE